MRGDNDVRQLFRDGRLFCGLSDPGYFLEQMFMAANDPERLVVVVTVNFKYTLAEGIAAVDGQIQHRVVCMRCVALLVVAIAGFRDIVFGDRLIFERPHEQPVAALIMLAVSCPEYYGTPVISRTCHLGTNNMGEVMQLTVNFPNDRMIGGGVAIFPIEYVEAG